MHFNTLCAVSMIQNVSQNRTDKKITKEDLDRIFKASYMAVFSNPEQTINANYGLDNEQASEISGFLRLSWYEINDPRICKINP